MLYCAMNSSAQSLVAKAQSETIQKEMTLYIENKDSISCEANHLRLEIPDTDLSLVVLSVTSGAIIVKDQAKGLWNFIPTCPAESYTIYVSQKNKIKQIKQLKQLGKFELEGLN